MLQPDSTSDIKLSILIPTLPWRTRFLARLQALLKPQLAAHPEVEVIVLADDGSEAIGAKRNRMVQLARGEFVAFIDDDDRVAPDYVSALLAGIAQDVDCVGIRGIHRYVGSTQCDDFIDQPYQAQGSVTVKGHTTYFRGAQHLDAVRRDIALAVPFPAIRRDEDRLWTRELHLSGLIRIHTTVDHPIYFYDDIPAKPVATSPELAVVMPCYNHSETTFHCVESLMAATACRDFKLILIDDGSTDGTPGVIELLHRRWPHHIIPQRNHTNLGVNASWNVGVTLAYALNAEHIAIVNNDLMFAEGWDVPLLAALRDPAVGVVSPLSTFGQIPPDWPAGSGRDTNPAGYQGYMPILGAAFASRLDLFDRIGMFPEEMRHYYGDNWLVIAAQYAGLACSYVPDSYIHHHFACTTSGLTNDEIWPKDAEAFKPYVERLGNVRPYAPRPEEYVPDEIMTLSEEVAAL